MDWYSIRPARCSVRTSFASFAACQLSQEVWWSIAQFERELASQRTKEGLAAAQKRGKRLGRPPSLSLDELNEARLRHKNGASLVSLAKHYGMHA
ncbi:recombinase family protein [uncultured Roseobacter sp.]|uniref:recombinase family protein n=1 Tax=uncultured Roseobacter sp. TaxID=114847 RepID=UPI00345665F8